MAVRRRKDRKIRAQIHAKNGAAKMRDLTAAVSERVNQDQGVKPEQFNGRRVIKNAAEAFDTFGQAEFKAVRPKLKLTDQEQAAINKGELELSDVLLIREKQARRAKRPVIHAISHHCTIHGKNYFEFVQPRQAPRKTLTPFEALPIGTNAVPALGHFAATHNGFWNKPEKQETAESKKIRSILNSNKLTFKQKGEKLRLLIEGPAVSHTKGAKIRVSPSEAQKDHGER